MKNEMQSISDAESQIKIITNVFFLIFFSKMSDLYLLFSNFYANKIQKPIKKLTVLRICKIYHNMGSMVISYDYKCV